MMYDALQDVVTQYRKRICSGLSHLEAINLIEARIGQPLEYYSEFETAIKRITENIYLRRWWRDAHAPFRFRHKRSRLTDTEEPLRTAFPVDTTGYIGRAGKRSRGSGDGGEGDA